jgi:hypothetical protein
MARERLFVEADTVLLSSAEGGRNTPVLERAYNAGMRIHLVLQDRAIRAPKIEVRDGHKQVVDEYLSVAFWRGPVPTPIGTPFLLTLNLWIRPFSIYDGCVPGADFTLREGHRIIGHGEIKRRWLETCEETAIA